MIGDDKMQWTDKSPQKIAHMIGCAKCQHSDWKLFVTEDKSAFVARCKECGHSVDLIPESVRNKPEEKAYDWRFFQ